MDFSTEMERTLQVLDYAILVISGADGVQGHTSTLWRLLDVYKVPVFIFVNKMDQPGTDKAALLEELQERLDSRCTEFGGGEGAAFFERVALCDEGLFESSCAAKQSGKIKEVAERCSPVTGSVPTDGWKSSCGTGVMLLSPVPRTGASSNLWDW